METTTNCAQESANSALQVTSAHIALLKRNKDATHERKNVQITDVIVDRTSHILEQNFVSVSSRDGEMKEAERALKEDDANVALASARVRAHHAAGEEGTVVWVIRNGSNVFASVPEKEGEAVLVQCSWLAVNAGTNDSPPEMFASMRWCTQRIQAAWENDKAFVDMVHVRYSLHPREPTVVPELRTYFPKCPQTPPVQGVDVDIFHSRTPLRPYEQGVDASPTTDPRTGACHQQTVKPAASGFRQVEVIAIPRYPRPVPPEVVLVGGEATPLRPTPDLARNILVAAQVIYTSIKRGALDQPARTLIQQQALFLVFSSMHLVVRDHSASIEAVPELTRGVRVLARACLSTTTSHLTDLIESVVGRDSDVHESMYELGLSALLLFSECDIALNGSLPNERVSDRAFTPLPKYSARDSAWAIVKDLYAIDAIPRITPELVDALQAANDLEDIFKLFEGVDGRRIIVPLLCRHDPNAHSLFLNLCRHVDRISRWLDQSYSDGTDVIERAKLTSKHLKVLLYEANNVGVKGALKVDIRTNAKCRICYQEATFLGAECPTTPFLVPCCYCKQGGDDGGVHLLCQRHTQMYNSACVDCQSIRVAELVTSGIEATSKQKDEQVAVLTKQRDAAVLEKEKEKEASKAALRLMESASTTATKPSPKKADEQRKAMKKASQQEIERYKYEKRQMTLQMEEVMQEKKSAESRVTKLEQELQQAVHNLKLVREESENDLREAYKTLSATESARCELAEQLMQKKKHLKKGETVQSGERGTQVSYDDLTVDTVDTVDTTLSTVVSALVTATENVVAAASRSKRNEEWQPWDEMSTQRRLTNQLNFMLAPSQLVMNVKLQALIHYDKERPSERPYIKMSDLATASFQIAQTLLPVKQSELTKVLKLAIQPLGDQFKLSADGERIELLLYDLHK